jgi:RNA polymerase sigma factor (sigma-70 family)
MFPTPFVSVHVIVVMSATLPAAVAGPVSDVLTERLGTMFDAHHQRLFRLARRLSPGIEEARDLVQETFLRAARAQHSIPSGSEEAWLVRVLVNIRKDEWRRQAAKKRIDPEREALSLRAEPSDHEAAFIAKTTVWRALERLPPRRRAIIVMYELEGTSIAAIAKLLGVNAVTVRWHLSRGRRELAEVIER